MVVVTYSIYGGSGMLKARFISIAFFATINIVTFSFNTYAGTNNAQSLGDGIKEQTLAGTTYKSQYGAIATVHPLATKAAAHQLENGGNAIDAVIAAALTLGVVDSYNSGIGGGLFALVRWADGRVEAIDAREMAPAKAHRDMYVRDGKVQTSLSRDGALAVGIPGSVAAFEYLSTAGGEIKLATLYRQAADIAESGFVVLPDYHHRLQRTADKLQQFPEAAEIFLYQQQPWPIGHQLVQKDLSNTYRMLAEKGSSYFYKGGFATSVDEWMSTNDGLITTADFAGYELRLRKPVHSHFLGHDIYGFPPPSSGGVHVAEILNIMQQFDFPAMSDTDRQHIMVESMKLAFADRAHWLGDPDFTDVPRGLVSETYAKRLAQKINAKQATAVITFNTPDNAEKDLFDKHTTHISVADAQGNWVAMTTTLNTSFGSKVVIPGTGVLMNNQMDDFAAQPNVPNAYGLVGSESNSVQPKKRPLSSMSPTIVVRNKQPVMAIGAAGGPMIITQVAQGIMNFIGLQQSLYQSLASPRIHQQWKPDKVFFDKTLPIAQQEALADKGHQLKQLRFEGSANAVSKTKEGFDAVSEPRLIQRNQLSQ
jgi:gamma-glutamyltranspeptidase/glutathione hydrolase